MFKNNHKGVFMLNQNNQELFKPSKEFSRNARIKNLCEYYVIYAMKPRKILKVFGKDKHLRRSSGFRLFQEC